MGKDMQNVRHLPLERVTVIEITTSWAGPLCGAMLADMGAEVIKFENPLSPDISRDSPPFADKIKGLNRSGWFAIHNRGKKDCLLDLKLPENVEIIKQLVKTSDIVIENFAPRVMDSLGLGYSVLREINKDIIMISLSGYGATGPDKDCVAFGENIEAQSGLSALIGSPGSPPQGCG
jgi:benzylsuccinate CoA-transferase BbsF subunit